MRRFSLGCCGPRFAILDELDSGLDFDALRLVGSAGGGRLPKKTRMGVLAITHYSRLFEQLRPDTVHVFAGGSNSTDWWRGAGHKSWKTPVTNGGVIRRRRGTPG